MPLCCGDSYSLSPTTFGHGSLPVSPQQSKHKLVSSAASVSTQNILTSSGLLLFGEANINNRLVCIYIVCIAFFKAQVRAQSQAVSRVFLDVTSFFILRILLAQKDLKLPSLDPSNLFHIFHCSYILNSSSMVKASMLTFNLKALGESINEVRHQNLARILTSMYNCRASFCCHSHIVL